MSAKICRSLVAMRAEAKVPAYSASATQEQTTGMRVQCVETSGDTAGAGSG